MPQDILKNLGIASQDLGMGDILKQQLAVKAETARQVALKGKGATDAQLSMSPATQSLFNFLGGGSVANDLLF